MTLNIHFQKVFCFCYKKKKKELNYAPSGFTCTHKNTIFPFLCVHRGQFPNIIYTAVGLDLLLCTARNKKKKKKKKTSSSVSQTLSMFNFPAKKTLVQRFLLDPDGGAVEGRAVPQVPAQDVLAELG